MNELLESNDADSGADPTPSVAPSAVSSPAPSFPPPAPPDADDGKRLKVLAVVTALALTGALVMGLLWMSSNSATSDAEEARDAALDEAEATAARQSDIADELATARADLAAAEAGNEALTAERDDAVASLEDTAVDAEDLRIQIGLLTETNDQAVDDLATLRQELEAAQTAAEEAAASRASAESEPATESEEPTVAEETPVAEPEDEAPNTTTQPSAPAEFDIDANPDFARYIGETLSSRNGASRLGQAQSECFGTALVNDIGLNALGRGLTLAASADDNNTVVGAMQRAAGTCNIALGLIF